MFSSFSATKTRDIRRRKADKTTQVPKGELVTLSLSLAKPTHRHTFSLHGTSIHPRDSVPRPPACAFPETNNMADQPKELRPATSSSSLPASEPLWQANLRLLEETPTVRRLSCDDVTRPPTGVLLKARSAPTVLSTNEPTGTLAPAAAAAAAPAAAAPAAAPPAVLHHHHQHRHSENECVVCHDPQTETFWVCPCDESHVMCAEDMATYVATRLETHEINPVPCPAFRCSGSVSDADAQMFLAAGRPELLPLYLRVRELSHDESARACPKCSHIVRGGSAEHPAMTCDMCHQEFCFLHETAHAGARCGQQKTKDSLAGRTRTKVWKALHTKACPECGIAIIRSGGCAHMVCQSCSHEFCWNCGLDWKKVSSTKKPKKKNHLKFI